MKEEYEKLITEHDRVLSVLRQHWIDADDNEKSKWMQQINHMLDERFRLMQFRDKPMTVTENVS
jgi:predicted adenine nucleotide alpha hydrolase (AANH) superfamily ATPase